MVWRESTIFIMYKETHLLCQYVGIQLVLQSLEQRVCVCVRACTAHTHC